MKRLSLVAAITSLLVTMASISWAATNLNSSRSNIYRVVYSTDGMTSAQAAAILAEVTRIGRGVDVAKLKEIALKVGVKLGPLQVIEIIPAARRSEGIPLILFLKNPMDKAQAIAVSDEGAPGKKSSK